MATRSTIALRKSDGTVKQSYCHWDGYLEGVGATLKEFYNTEEKVEALVDLGDLSSLEASIECPEGHTFDTKIGGYTVAYGRDRGEENVGVTIFKDVDNFETNKRGEDYNYLFTNGEWECDGKKF